MRRIALLAAILAAAFLSGCSDGQMYGNNNYLGGSATVGTF